MSNDGNAAKSAAVISLYNDCVCSSKVCSFVELLFLGSTIAVKTWCLVPNFLSLQDNTECPYINKRL